MGGLHDVRSFTAYIGVLAWLIVACATAPSVPPPSPVAHAPTAPEPVATPAAPSEPTPPPAPATPEPAASESPDVPPAGFAPIPDRRKKGFPGVAFAEVRAFAFDLAVSGQPVCTLPLDADGSLCSTVVRPGVALTSAQTKTLIDLIRARSTYGDGSACFLPHHGFVFYDDAGVPVAELSVCLMCDVMRSSPSIPGAREVGEGAGWALSKKGTAGLRAMCTALGLPMCDATNPMQFGKP